MKILGIETSCDETAAAVALGNGKSVQILSNIVSSQIEIHKKYGGVVPEVAAREHVLNILPVINEALETAGLKNRLSKRNQRPKKNNGIATLHSAPLAMTGIDAIAVTVGPGLITSLITGIETAKSLAYAWNIPLIEVNHIEGHIYANFICENFKSQKTSCKQIPPAKQVQANLKKQTHPENIKFPAVILTVSGGHTMLVLMERHGRFKTIGETRDDAAGEAFDKAAKMMGIGYPGGPIISAEAAKLGIRERELGIRLPRPMIDSDNFDFSFSGLKTALRYALEDVKNWKEYLELERKAHSLGKDKEPSSGIVPWRFTPIDKLAEKLALAARYADNIINWGYYPFMNPLEFPYAPFSGHKKEYNKQAYEAYKKYYIETISKKKINKN